MKKTLALTVIAALALTACGGSASGDWESEVRAMAAEDSLTQEDCEGFAFMGVDSPQAAVDLVGTLTGQDPYTTPLADFDDMMGDEAVGDLAAADLAEAGVPMDLTVGEVFEVAFDEAMSDCDWDAAAAGNPFAEEEATEAEAVPVAIGDEFLLGDWAVTVTDVVLDANAEAEALGYPMDWIDGKGLFTKISFDATYMGDDQGDVEWDISWAFIGNDALEYGPAGIMDESENEDWPTVARNGGTVSDIAWLDIDPDAADGGFIVVEDSAGFSGVSYELPV